MFVGTVIRDDMGLTLDNAGKEVLGTAIKVVITKDSTLLVSDGSTRKAVEMRVSQLRKLVEVPCIPFNCFMNLFCQVQCCELWHKFINR